MKTSRALHVVLCVVVGVGVGVGGAAAAVVGPTTPSIDATAEVSPSKAGTRANPKPVTLTLTVADSSDSGATAAKLKFVLPETLRLSAYRLRKCEAPLQALRDNADLCTAALAGTGSAHLVAGWGTPGQQTVEFDVKPYVRTNKVLLFVFRSSTGGNHVARGDIVDGELRITLPEGLREPAPGFFTAFDDFTVSLYKRTGTRYLVRSVGCANRVHRIKMKVVYAPNPLPPATAAASDVAEAPCTKAG